MHEDVRTSRLRVSRRRALGLGGTVGLAGVLAACGGSATTGTTATGAPTSPAAAATDDVVALLDRANTCTLSAEQTQGPYWFDVDSLRSDVREGRPGTDLTLALRVQDVTGCVVGTAGMPVPRAVVEIWHCDAGGVYSGFESSSAGANGRGEGTGGAPGGPPPGGGPRPGGGAPPAGGTPPGGGGGGAGGETSGEVSDGSYSVGDTEAATSDDGTYLRGAQPTDTRGIATFTTIYPGWYRGRTMHIHVKVHVDRRTVLTTQLFADDAYTDAVYRVEPYSAHTGRDTTNATDGIYAATGLMTLQPSGSGHLGVINLGVDL